MGFEALEKAVQTRPLGGGTDGQPIAPVTWGGFRPDLRPRDGTSCADHVGRILRRQGQTGGGANAQRQGTNQDDVEWCDSKFHRTFAPKNSKTDHLHGGSDAKMSKAEIAADGRRGRRGFQYRGGASLFSSPTSF